ncbi:MAG TPA: type VI secretion protein IcmF/TssM N-terminal domain-containing protein [Gammaproteobacteria bacterium]|nr:type VI secretion protein IcmF/TssM N-terminal domain-containing protein [Gammaproteobacteria bacterium]
MSADVIAQLKKADLSYYALPWIMVLGPKKSGKSALLTHSGLSCSWDYVQSENSRWFFSDKAIFIEIDFELDKDAWMALLAFLKKVRPRVPLNGILLVLSASEAYSVKIIREHLAEIAEHLGYLFPVTTLFTHIDHISGFENYFAHTEITAFQRQEDNYTSLFSAAYSLTQSESDTANKFKILNFPENFQQHSNRLSIFLKELTKSNPYQETPDFREMYFTGQAYFVPGMIERVLSGISSHNQKSRKQLWLTRWFASVSLITASIIVVIVFLVASASFAHSAYKIHEGIQLGQIIETSNNTDDYVNLAHYLSAKPPYELVPVLQDLFIHGVEKQVMPNIFNQLENQLALTQEQWALATSQEAEAMRGEYYNQLKTYLLFCHPRYRYPQFYQGNPLMAFYLNHSNKQWSARPDLVQLSRQQLYVSPNLTNIYAGLVSWGEKQLGYTSAKDLFGKTLDGEIKIPVFFTAKGFGLYALPEIDRVARESAKGDWVMRSAPESIKDNLLVLYKADYKKNWISFLQNLRPALGATVTDKTVRKIIAIAHQNILFKEANLQTDPALKSAIQNVMLLPQLTKLMAEMNAQWLSQVYDFYAEKISRKYPFVDSPDEVDPQDFKQFFDLSQGLLWQFVHKNPSPNIKFSDEYTKALAQASRMVSEISLEIYPEPTVGLKEIRLVSNKQSYRYRNGPQEWQKFQWKLAQDNDESALEIITSSGSEGSIEFDSPWGFFRLLQKAELSKHQDGTFQAHWNIRADNGHYYAVNFLFKINNPNNLVEVLLFQHFRLPEELFTQVS